MEIAFISAIYAGWVIIPPLSIASGNSSDKTCMFQEGHIMHERDFCILHFLQDIMVNFIFLNWTLFFIPINAVEQININPKINWVPFRWTVHVILQLKVQQRTASLPVHWITMTQLRSTEHCCTLNHVTWSDQNGTQFVVDGFILICSITFAGVWK